MHFKVGLALRLVAGSGAELVSGMSETIFTGLSSGPGTIITVWLGVSYTLGLLDPSF